MTQIRDSRAAILRGVMNRCPSCGEGQLMQGYLKVNPVCAHCQAPLSRYPAADGPAFFIMMTMAFPVTAFGIWLELAYDPPLWVHAVVTLPLLLLACVPIIRPMKGLFIASQYINKAEEGRFAVQKPTGVGPAPRD